LWLFLTRLDIDVIILVVVVSVELVSK